MAKPQKVKIDVNKLASQFTVYLTITGMCRFRIRLWIALQLTKLAALVSGMKWEILAKPNGE
ncbi:MAG: hypothetical protein PHI12_08870 [Dehalococcoidales bacterium]|nr:hypothetical protein [Dehalococcoidales bacterium]